MKITKLSAQVKNPDRVNVFLDGKYSFSLTIDQVLEHKVKKDLEIDEQDVKKFEKLSLDGKLRQRALEWLMIRPHSEKEVMDYFRRRLMVNRQGHGWMNLFREGIRVINLLRVGGSIKEGQNKRANSLFDRNYDKRVSTLLLFNHFYWKNQ